MVVGEFVYDDAGGSAIALENAARSRCGSASRSSKATPFMSAPDSAIAISALTSDSRRPRRRGRRTGRQSVARAIAYHACSGRLRRRGPAPGRSGVEASDIQPILCCAFGRRWAGGSTRLAEMLGRALTDADAAVRRDASRFARHGRAVYRSARMSIYGSDTPPRTGAPNPGRGPSVA